MTDPSAAREDQPAPPPAGACCPIPSLPAPAPVRLTTLPPHPCNYLPGRTATLRAFLARRLPGRMYHQFMDAGFRRGGQMIYQPVCTGCRACMPIRVPVNDFAPNKSQRRCHRSNGDLSVSIAEPELTTEKSALYQRYVASRHQNSGSGQTDADASQLEAFLYRSPVESREFSYRLPDGSLVAVGICDVCEDSLSSVYFYFEPELSRRGLGTFGALVEIQYAREQRIPYYYLGYWVRDCRAMQYKSNFRPCEVLGPDGAWREFPRHHEI